VPNRKLLDFKNNLQGEATCKRLYKYGETKGKRGSPIKAGFLYFSPIFFNTNECFPFH